MSDPAVKTPTPSNLYPTLVDPGSKVPVADEIFLNPVSMIRCLMELSPKITATGAWWSVAGKAGENLLDVHLKPTNVDILTNGEGVEKILAVLKEYSPSAPRVVERRLAQGAEVDGKTHAVFVRSNSFEFQAHGVKVIVHGDYSIKVGDWEWGDTFVFEPISVNIAGTQVPVMPLRLRSEIYITLGWMDRAQLVTDATMRAHHFLQTVGDQRYG